MNRLNWLRRRPDGFWVVVIILATLAVSTFLSWVYWDWLRDGESGSSTVRNVGLLVGAIVAMVLAVWRSRVAGRQAATAERGLLNDRFQKGAEMLGSKILAVRIGGIYGLQQLAGEYPQHYHVQVMRLFCSFVRDLESITTSREDVKAILDAIGARRACHIQLERDAEYWLDLSNAQLSDASLQGANLSGGGLRIVAEGMLPNGSLTDLSSAQLWRANLESADLRLADLSDAVLANANLTRANLAGTNLSGTKLSLQSLNGDWNPAIRLTQSQIDGAQVHPDNPPHLEGVLDAETGKQLVWQDQSMNDKTFRASERRP